MSRSFFRTYGFLSAMLLAIVLGCVLGALWPGAPCLAPLGTIFINLMFCIVVPLVFCSLSSSIACMKSPKRAGRIMGTTLLVFIVTGLIAAVIMLFAMRLYPPVLEPWADAAAGAVDEQASVAQLLVNFFTVEDFAALLSRRAMLPLIVFSLLIGFGVNLSGGADCLTAKVLQDMTNCLLKVVSLISYYAPVAFFGFFASLVATYGAKITAAYGRAMLVYYPLCFVYALVAFPLYAYLGGKKEGESPLAAEFDELHSDNRLGQASWEAAETQLQLQTARLCLKKAHATEKDVSLLLAGDLQAQCTASGYAARALGLPFAGLFGACSTMAEALGVGACLCSAGMADGLLAMTSSHFCTAERQFRTPLSYGAVRTPTAQWTATAAGACLLRPAGQGVGIRAVTFGRVQDLGIRDINNMGAAMAPAAAATLLRYLTDTNTQPQEFDAICTGDLGHVGSQLFRELLAAEGLLLKNHIDCGSLLYDAEGQSVHSGASGPGCCAAVLCGHLLPRLERRGQRRVLFLATGALMSQTTFLQKESIPAISHLVELAAPEEQNGGNT